MGDQGGIASSLSNLGNVAYEQGDYAQARSFFEQSLAIRREMGDKRGIAMCLNNLGNVAYGQGDYAGERSFLEESLAIKRELGNKSGIVVSLVNLGNAAYGLSDYAAARVLLEESLTIARELGNRSLTAYNLDSLASLAIKEAQKERGARLWGASSALREVIGSPLLPAERDKQEREITAARERLGEDAFAAAWAEGQAMTMEQAIEYALEGKV